MPNDINFKEEVIVSVHEKQTNRRLEILSIVFLFIGLFIAIAFFFLNLVATKNLEDASAIEANLLSQIQAPENQKKETLYFLIKDRLGQINNVDKTRVRTDMLMQTISKIDQDVKIDSVFLDGNICNLTFKIDNYAKFDTFKTKLKEYGIDENTFVAEKTVLANNEYTIDVKFSFNTGKKS
jgi:hypothetical protein